MISNHGMHTRWHTRRNQYNPSCKYCVAEGQPDGAKIIESPKPVRGDRRHDLPLTVTGFGGPDGIFGRKTGSRADKDTPKGSDTSRPIYVYALHSGDRVYRYVGTSRNPYMRLCVHKSNSRPHVKHKSNDALYSWVREIGPENLHMDLIDGPVFTMPETVEREWCFFFYTQGYDMLNLKPEYLTGWRSTDSERAQNTGKKSSHVRWHAKRGLWNPYCAICLEENPTGKGLEKTEGSSLAKHRV